MAPAENVAVSYNPIEITLGEIVLAEAITLLGKPLNSEERKALTKGYSSREKAEAASAWIELFLVQHADMCDMIAAIAAKLYELTAESDPRLPHDAVIVSKHYRDLLEEALHVGLARLAQTQPSVVAFIRLPPVQGVAQQRKWFDWARNTFRVSSVPTP